jgi:hypothetical protein
MANDLVRWGRLDANRDPNRNETDPQDDNEQWDRPPLQPRLLKSRFAPPRRRKADEAAQVADMDAAAARQRGDHQFAFVREGDAADLRQNPWDWGDLRTWMIIVGLCVGIFIFTAFVYFMPQGRHNQNDGPTPTPMARYY